MVTVRMRSEVSANNIASTHWYSANELFPLADFKYLTPKLRLEPEMLSDEQVMSRSFHMVCSSERAIRIVEEITRRRKDLQPAQTSRPIFVWEPVPDRCTPEDRETFLAACRVIDIVSPNELELGMMFGRPGWNEDISEDREIVNRILRSGIGADKNGIIVIRAGKDGCYAYGKGQRRLWLPAYHQPAPDGQSPVVDPTGAGNSFLGALAQGMVSDDDRAPMQIIASTLAGSAAWSRLVDAWGDKRQVPKALICATTAAGFVVEQIGVPNVSKAADGSECWNGTRFTERLHMYTQRLCKILEESSQTQTWLTE